MDNLYTKFMKIWFGCTTKDWEEHRKYYLDIRNFIIELGGILVFDWIPGTDEYLINKGDRQGQRDMENIFKKIVEAISRCDLSITEYTVPNFSSSHQINFSLMRNKPTLVLRRKIIGSKFNNSYLDAIGSSLLTVRDYENDEYKNIIKEFIGEFKNGYGYQRYNVVLDKRHNYYLSWASEKYSRSKSEILRELIEKDIDSNEDFKKTIRV
jgi:hypothetical protein